MTKTILLPKQQIELGYMSIIEDDEVAFRYSTETELQSGIERRNILPKLKHKLCAPQVN